MASPPTPSMVGGGRGWLQLCDKDKEPTRLDTIEEPEAEQRRDEYHHETTPLPPLPRPDPDTVLIDQVPGKDVREAEEARRRLAAQIKAPCLRPGDYERASPDPYKYLSPVQERWITLTAKLRVRDICASLPDPAGVEQDDVYRVGSVPRPNWWRFPKYRGLREAMRIGQKFVMDRLPRPRRCRNYPAPSRAGVAAAATEFDRMLRLGVLEGPYAEDSDQIRCVSPIGMVEKKTPPGAPAKIRLIYDLTESGVNKEMTALPFSLPTVIDGTIGAGERSHWAKVDLQDAFWHVTVADCHRPLLGLRAVQGASVSAEAAAHWPAAWPRRVRADGRVDVSGKLFRGTRALFGLSSSPFHFCAITELVQYCVGEMGGRALAFVDDLLCASTRGETEAVAAQSCEAWVCVLRAIFTYLGLKEALQKYEGPAQEVDWLGLRLSSITGKITIPEDKKAKLIKLIDEFTALYGSPGGANKASAGEGAADKAAAGLPDPADPNSFLNWFPAPGTGSAPARTTGAAGQGPPRHDLLSLIGKLSFASAAVPGGRTFLRRMYDGVPGQESAKIELTDDFFKDLDFWRHAVEHSSGATMAQHYPSPPLSTISDASGIAAGYTIRHADGGRERHTVAWADGDGAKSSNWRELKAIVDMTRRYAQAWQGRRIMHATDNTTAVCAVNKGSVRGVRGEEDLMTLVRELRQITAEYDLDLNAYHTSGEAMIEEGTDGLSRPRRGAPPTFHLRSDVVEFWQETLQYDAGETIYDVADMTEREGQMAGRRVLLILPFDQIHEALDIMCKAKRVDPVWTGCTVVAPAWEHPSWARQLRYFNRVQRVERGGRLFGRTAGGACGPSPMAMEVWHMGRGGEARLSRQAKGLINALTDHVRLLAPRHATNNPISLAPPTFPRLSQVRAVGAARHAAASWGVGTTQCARVGTATTGIWATTPSATQYRTSSSSRQGTRTPPLCPSSRSWGARFGATGASSTTCTDGARGSTWTTTTSSPLSGPPSSTGSAEHTRTRRASSTRGGWGKPPSLDTGSWEGAIGCLRRADRGSTGPSGGVRCSTSTSHGPAPSRGRTSGWHHPRLKTFAPQSPRRVTRAGRMITTPLTGERQSSCSKGSSAGRSGSPNKRLPSPCPSSWRSPPASTPPDPTPRTSPRARTPHWQSSSSRSFADKTPSRSRGARFRTSSAARVAPSRTPGGAPATSGSRSTDIRRTRSGSRRDSTRSDRGSSSPCGPVAEYGLIGSSTGTGYGNSACCRTGNGTRVCRSSCRCRLPRPSSTGVNGGRWYRRGISLPSGDVILPRRRRTASTNCDMPMSSGTHGTRRSTGGTRPPRTSRATAGPPCWLMDGPRGATARVDGGPQAT